MLTVHRQQHSFSTHERMFLWKRQSLWDRKCLDLRGSQTPNLRIHAECSNHLSYRGQIFAVPCCWILALAVETWSSLNSTWLRRRGEWPLLLAKPSSVHGWTGRELRPRNCHGLPWWLWIPSPSPCFFAPPTTSFPPLLTTNSGGFTGDDTCGMCKSARWTSWHVLSSCGSSIQGKFRWFWFLKEP